MSRSAKSNKSNKKSSKQNKKTTKTKTKLNGKSSKQKKKAGKGKNSKTKNLSKTRNLKPSAINKNKGKSKQTANNSLSISLASDFGINFDVLIDGYIRENNINIQIFIDISKLIYSYTLSNLQIGCWSYYLTYSMPEWMSYYSHYYTLEIKDSYSFILNCADYTVEDEYFADYLHTLQLKGYFEIDKKNKYILFFEPNKTTMELFDMVKKKGKKNGLFINKELVINDKDREKIYLKRILNVYKSQKINNDQLLKMHKRYKTDKSKGLNWECVCNKLFNDWKYGKLDIQSKKKNKAIVDMPDMHVLYRKLCNFYGIKPLGLYIGKVYIKWDKDKQSVKIKYGKINFFQTIQDLPFKDQHIVELKKVDRKDTLHIWEEFYHGNGVRRHKDQIEKMGYTFAGPKSYK